MKMKNEKYFTLIFRTSNMIYGNFREYFYFYAWGASVNLRNREVRTCDKREITIYVDFVCSATGGLSPREGSALKTNELNVLNICLAQST
jgi:hypothetical protein